MNTQGHRIAILGGGVAGLHVASRLASRFRVTLIDREPAHVWKPMLHRIAAGTRAVLPPQTSYVAQARERGFVFVPGTVTGIDRGARQVQIAPLVDGTLGEVVGARVLDYDTLVLALGSLADRFRTPGVVEHCRTIDSRAQAMAFSHEMRLRVLDAAAHRGRLSIGIVGGGATGVELAAELAQLADLAEYYGADGIAGRVGVTLLESGPRILRPLPERIARESHARLEELGVTVLTDARVERASDLGLHLADGRIIEPDISIWAVGVRAPDVLGTLKVTCGGGGQVVVSDRLRSLDAPEIFALGDCASLTPGSGRLSLAPTAQVAYQQACYLCRHLPALIDGDEVPPFRFREPDALVSVGGYGEFGSLGMFSFFRSAGIRGRIAHMAHVLLYRSHLVQLHGVWRGTLMWAVDLLNSRQPKIGLDRGRFRGPRHEAPPEAMAPLMPAKSLSASAEKKVTARHK